MREIRELAAYQAIFNLLGRDEFIVYGLDTFFAGATFLLAVMCGVVKTIADEKTKTAPAQI